MISYLAVKNVSVIEGVSFELSKGLTVLTGETGSGKSVLVGALKLLLGERFTKNMLREGAERLMVEGIFDDVHAVPAHLKEQFHIEDELIIRREADEAGKNRVFINSILSTASQLKEFAPYLADIHGQHEHQTLLDESRHLELVDHLVPKKLLDDYQEEYTKYRKVKAQRDALLADLDEVKKHQDIVKFQLAEIAAAEINLDKDADLDERIAYMTHIEKIQSACATSLDALSDGEVNAIELISRTIRALAPIEGMMSEVGELNKELNGALDVIVGSARTLTALFDKQEASPEALDQLVQRKFILQDLIKKYGDGSLASVVESQKQLEEKLKNFENSDELLNKLGVAVDESFVRARSAADTLLEARRAAADKIGVQVAEILAELELPDSVFTTNFSRKDGLDSQGGAEAKFYLSVNKGFAPAPLAQVASGGEISRVMLALKEVFSDVDGTSTLLFDEIDTGISGRTAKKVAMKLHNLSKKKQIIVITHLPVVAAAGDSHFHIAKKVDNNATKTDIRYLSTDERSKIIASMVAGEVTESSLMQAKELLQGQ